MRHFTRRGNSSIVIEAAKVGTDQIENIVNWCGGQIIEERDALSDHPLESVNLKTPTGRKRASVGQYIVKTAGQFMIVSAYDFERMYDTNEAPRPRSEAEDPSPPVNRLIGDPFEGMTRFNDGPRP